MINEETLIKLGYTKEPIINNHKGSYYVWSLTGNDSFIEVVNYYDLHGVFISQKINHRLIRLQVEDYTKTEIELLTKRILK